MNNKANKTTMNNKVMKNYFISKNIPYEIIENIIDFYDTIKEEQITKKDFMILHLNLFYNEQKIKKQIKKMKKVSLCKECGKIKTYNIYCNRCYHNLF